MNENLALDADFTDEQYRQGAEQQNLIPTELPVSAVTNINGLSGPIVTFAGGTTGLSFSTASPNVNLSGTLVVAHGGTGATTATGARTNLGIPKWNFAAAVAPVVTDDSGSGYAVGSRWIDTVGQQEYVCISAGVGAAVWKQTTV